MARINPVGKDALRGLLRRLKEMDPASFASRAGSAFKARICHTASLGRLNGLSCKRLDDSLAVYA